MSLLQWHLRWPVLVVVHTHTLAHKANALQAALLFEGKGHNQDKFSFTMHICILQTFRSSRRLQNINWGFVFCKISLINKSLVWEYGGLCESSQSLDLEFTVVSKRTILQPRNDSECK